MATYEIRVGGRYKLTHKLAQGTFAFLFLGKPFSSPLQVKTSRPAQKSQ